MERTFVIVKPDCVQRALTGEIIKRLEQRGLKLLAGKFIMVSQELAEKHYAAHVGKPFYKGLVKYITAAPVMAMIWEGPEAVSAVRNTMGATDPVKADPGSIRHDYAVLISRNLTHASDSVESAEKEIALWFKPEEICDWDRTVDPWLLGKN